MLDLDHTLLHATADKRASKWIANGTDCDLHVVLLPMMEGHPLYEKQQQNGGGGSGLGGGVQIWQPHYVKLRPTSLNQDSEQ